MTQLNIRERIFNISSEEEFNGLAIEIFLYQVENNPVYKKYVNCICKDLNNIRHFEQIPFLPVEFFRTQKVITGNKPVQTIFKSSGTTGQARSYHYVTDLAIYEKAAITAYERVYGKVADYTILALLPSYLERKDSSLVWMTQLFINKSNYKEDCGFYLNEYSIPLMKLKKINETKSRKILLLGVSYALLDLAEKIDFSLENAIVMETGGMKGKRKEILRKELHEILCKKFGITSVHSEYGMTELLSQAYSQDNGIYKCLPWMKVLVREMNDPLTLTELGRNGGINIIDLANINSCSFIATQDMGKLFKDGSFEVSGRFDQSETRGCNLFMS
jgi:phenylacetate-coenzyme A ligase PaaK-like adenylate-forming protein